jgi:diacylglycerol kinase (ATP)
MTRKFFVIANPYAGRKKVGKLLKELSDFFLAQQHEVIFEVHETTAESKGNVIVSQNLDESFTDLVIVGGDGTIHEAVNGLKYDIPVSIVPAGTGNDYVKELSIGKSTSEHFETVINGTITNVDLGVCNGQKFVNGVGIGFDGQIVADMIQRKTPLLSGQAKYYYHVLHILSGYRSRAYRVTVDGKFHHKMMILMTIAKGTTFGGGFKLTPHAKLDDGQLAVCEVATIPAWKRYANILRLQNGSHDTLKEVQLYKAKSLLIEENNLLEGHIDGEYLGKPPFDISMLPGGLKVRQRFGK